MTKDWKITYFRPDRPGVFYKEDGIEFAVIFDKRNDCGILFYDEDGKTFSFPFGEECFNGTLAGIRISFSDPANRSAIRYNYYSGKTIFTDPYAPMISGLEIWGDVRNGPRKTIGVIPVLKKDSPEAEPNPMIPYEDSIIYGLNVRSFTMHKSAGVKHRGTFEGVAEKIPHFKELGITAVELMPCYEYEECMFPTEKFSSFTENGQPFEKKIPKDESVRLNCWGFQQGYYFAPKASYSASKDPIASFKNMVTKLHKNNIEVLMHFYFPPQIRALQILDVLKFWVNEYHVDGFRISGCTIPYRIITEEPILKYTKIRFSYLPEEVCSIEDACPVRNLSIDHPGFLTDMRRYLKGDEGLITQMLEHHRNNKTQYGMINYLTDYNTFSLYDMVSYDRKHNEANGEENRDGSEVNDSWNCGIEGDSRKKSVQTLRLRQMKNALALLFLSQGTPYLFAGDELANTRFGNNNPYCQDNEIGFVKWKENKFSKEIFSYTKYLILLRKSYRILHMPDAFKLMDARGCGVPDISYHGVEAWRPDLGHMSRMIGIMLCGIYADEKESIYIGCNMHWEDHEMALPKLPRDMIWTKISDTAWQENDLPEAVADRNSMITVKARSIVIYRTEKIQTDQILKKRI